MNNVNLSGRVAATPEVRTTNGGKTVTNFRVIESDYYGGEEHQQTHRIVVWGEASAKYISEHIATGDLVELKGSIRYGKYEDEGITRYTTDIVTERVVRLHRPTKKDRG